MKLILQLMWIILKLINFCKPMLERKFQNSFECLHSSLNESRLHCSWVWLKIWRNHFEAWNNITLYDEIIQIKLYEEFYHMNVGKVARRWRTWLWEGEREWAPLRLYFLRVYYSFYTTQDIISKIQVRN